MREFWEIHLSNPDIIIDGGQMTAEVFEILVHQVMKGDPGPATTHPYLSLVRRRPYLYEVTFDRLPEDDGGDTPVIGGCSAYVRDGKLYRNYDWNYDNAASFIVRTRDFEGMSMITGLDDGAMDDSKISQLPYRMVDGDNNNGIMLSTHILFNDWQWSGVGEKSIPLTRLPFLVLSQVKSMETIADDLADVLGNLATTPGLDSLGYLLQCLITDGTTTYALIPPLADGQAYMLVDATANPKMSNFRWVARETVSRTDADIQLRPTGIERWNAMPRPLEMLRFTRCYEDPARLSEFIGLDDTTKDSSDVELLPIYQRARAAYLSRERDGKIWHTMHSVVYGPRGVVALWIQEDWDDCIIGEGRVHGTMDGSRLMLELRPDISYDGAAAVIINAPSARYDEKNKRIII